MSATSVHLNENGGGAEDQKREERPAPEARIDALAQNRGEERTESARHGKAIPEKPSVVGSPVVVGRSERGQEDSGKKKSGCEPDPRNWKTASAACTRQKRESETARRGKNGIREDVACVGNSTPGAHVGEPYFGIHGRGPTPRGDRCRDGGEGDGDSRALVPPVAMAKSFFRAARRSNNCSGA